MAVPVNTDEPVKVVVPAEAVSVPLTTSAEEMVRLVAVDMLPFAVRLYKLMAPVAVMVFEAPLMVTLPAVPVKLPAAPALRLPVMISAEVVDIVPLKVRSLKVNPLPVMLLPVPLMVNAPVLCVNAPTPVLVKLPVTAIFATDELILAPVNVRLKKLCVPEPLIVVLAPLRVTVLVDAV